MHMIKMTPRDEKESKKTKKAEERKRNINMFISRLLRRKLDPKDTRTIQEHKTASGEKAYYVSNVYLQTGANFSNVQTILEDTKGQRYVYQGMLGGADNAEGVIESNVPLSEIVASPDGNMKFLDMISEENATKTRNQYYKNIGEPEEQLEGHITHFGKPVFVLGTILKDKKGKFSYNSSIKQDIEEKLASEREEDEKMEALKDKEDIGLDLGGGWVVPKQDIWLEQTKGISFAGVNKQGLYWNYDAAPKPISVQNGKYYIQIGNLQIGESKTVRKTNEPLKLVNPYIYGDVVLYTNGQNLIQYFLNNKYDGLNTELGEIMTTVNLEKAKSRGEKDHDSGEEIKGDSPILLGGISFDEEGNVKANEAMPKEVLEALDKYIKERENKENDKSQKIVKFDRSED